MPLDQTYNAYARLARVQQEGRAAQRQLREGAGRRLDQVSRALAVVRPLLMAGQPLEETYQDLLDEQAKLRTALTV